MKPEQIEAIALAIANHIPELIGDIQLPIQDAAAAILEETQDSEGTKPILNIGISCKVNLATSPPKLALKASVAVRRSVEHTFELEDPNQPNLL
jgi:hypothetical protein